MRRAQTVTQIWTRMLPRYRSSGTTLQAQIRQMLIDGILSGRIRPGSAVPPSRSLAQELGVSRNSVTLAYQSLVTIGFLVARPRSGLFVSEDFLLGQAEVDPAEKSATTGPRWASRFKAKRLAAQTNISKPSNWQSFPFPFIYGQFDPTLIPLKDWRICAAQSLSAQATRQWSQDLIDGDLELMLDQIQDRLLPARGIIAKRSEILITAGAQMATYLLAQVLVDRNTVVGMENPGYPDARNNFELRTSKLRTLPVDANGLRAGDALSECAYVYVTPSHQCPTTVTMPLKRRQALLDMARIHNIVLFEDDHESELSFSGKPLPALKSLDSDGRVIYLGSLSKTLSHGLRLGYVVGPEELIRELRRLRRLVTRHPSSNGAYTAALFIAQGFHDSFLRKLNGVYRSRHLCLTGALAQQLPDFRMQPAQGGSAVWIEGPSGFDASALARLALQHGVLIEPGSVFFKSPTRSQQKYFRMGFSAIPESQIEEGVRRLAALLD